MAEDRLLGGRYRILDKVGSGGMAEVYRATDTVLSRTVAVKMMLPQFASDPTFAARFRQEAQAAAALNSPYIVSIYDWGMDGGTYYIVMEYIRGTDLKSGIRQHGPLANRKAAQIAAQVCAALSVAHKHEIIHRDIKPQNIMIQPDGSAKVMDFGIARAKDSHLTQTNSVLGTAHYVSPEQTQGKELGPESDIYSLGVVLYECVTGQVPFDGDTAVNVAIKQVNEQPVPPSQINPKVDAELEAIILTCMAKDPATRFSTADDLRRVLNNYIAGRPTGIAGAPIAAAAIPAGETAIGRTATTVMPRAATGNTGYIRSSYDEEELKEEESKRKIAIAAAVIGAIILIAALIFGLTQCNKQADAAVPNLMGLTQEQAVSKIETDEFKVGKITTQYSDAEKGTVIDQNPDASVMKPKGTPIDLVISSGTEPLADVTVPDITGLTAPQAEAKLKEVGLIPQAGEGVYDQNIEVGKVVNQDPAASTSVKEGTTVTYNVSLGSEDITIPDVVGQSEGNAWKTLEDAGFVVTSSSQESNSVAEGNVISMSPKSGNKAPKGSTVNLVISTGKPRAAIPNVVGQTEANAKKQLENAGFKVEVESIVQNDTGKVVSQNPAGGNEAVAGSTVTISVDNGKLPGGNDNNNGGSNEPTSTPGD